MAGSVRYLELLNQMKELHIQKNSGYAGSDNPDPWANFRMAEAFGVSAATGALVRMSDKYIRVTNLTKQPDDEQVGESIKDTLMDLAAYALIIICLMEEEEAPFSENVYDDYACCEEDCISCSEEGEDCDCDDRYNGCLAHNIVPPYTEDGAVIPVSIEEEIAEFNRKDSPYRMLTCYNRDERGNCLGHPVKDGPLYHALENLPENSGE